LTFLIGSFGASAVILFATPRSPVAQPRNLIGGHLIGAICGCLVRIALDQYEPSVSCALAVALSILIMQLTETLHPPGGATALIAVTSQPLLPWKHFLFILMPTLTGACCMLLVALIVNNLAPKRTYPYF
jgi:CBS-domain-containing membrane protein